MHSLGLPSVSWSHQAVVLLGMHAHFALRIDFHSDQKFTQFYFKLNYLTLFKGASLRNSALLWAFFCLYDKLCLNIIRKLQLN